MGRRELPRDQDKPDRERARARRHGWILKTHVMIIPTSIPAFIYLNTYPYSYKVNHWFSEATLKTNAEVMFAPIFRKIRKKNKNNMEKFLKLN